MEIRSLVYFRQDKSKETIATLRSVVKSGMSAPLGLERICTFARYSRSFVKNADFSSFILIATRVGSGTRSLCIVRLKPGLAAVYVAYSEKID